MRPIDKVIQAIIKLVPKEFHDYDNLVADLKKIEESSHYTAPEMMAERWNSVMECLNFYLAEQSSEWAKKISLLTQAKLNYEDVLKDAPL